MEIAIYNDNIPEFSTSRYCNYFGMVFMNHICYGNIVNTQGDIKCIICGEIIKFNP